MAGTALDLPPKSPLALIAAFTLVLRERFEAPNETPFVWTGDVNTSSVYVFSQYDKQSEAKDLAPKVVVTRGSYVHSRTNIGDLGSDTDYLLTRALQHGYQQSECDFNIMVVDQNMGAAEFLADVVAATIQMSAVPIEKAFGLLRISTLVIQPPQKYPADSEKWMVGIHFRVTFETRWGHMPTQTPITRARVLVRVVEAATTLAEAWINYEPPVP